MREGAPTLQTLYATMNYSIRSQQFLLFTAKALSPLPTPGCSAPESFRSEKQTYNQPYHGPSPNPLFYTITEAQR